MESNIDTMKIWPLVAGQAIVGGMGNIIDINHASVWEAIDRFDVIHKLETFKKICMLFRHFAAKRKSDGNKTR
jgi:hypothetical protein